MDAAALEAFLSSKRYGVMATSDAAGAPHARPVAYLVDRGVFLVATVAGARLRHVRARPQASLVVIAGDDADHRVVSVDGDLTILEGDAFEARYAPLADRWRDRHRRDPDWADALLELAPRRIYSYAAPR
jgi:general stress protein 26